VRLIGVLRLGIPLVLLAGLIAKLGTGPFQRSLEVLRPGPIAAALLLGGLTTLAQAMRWRTVAAGYGSGPELTRARAVGECYRSALLNAVLPGGVMGDAVRVWRHRGPARPGPALRASARAVVVERAAGTAVLMLCVAGVVFSRDPRIGLALLSAGIVTAAIAWPGLRRLTARAQLSVWGWSLLSLVALVTMFGVATAQLGTIADPRDVVTLALIALAGMSVPLAIAGFGPREAVVAIAFVSFGHSADAGVATAAAYGVLAAVSALPGVAVMVLDAHRAPRTGGAVVLRLDSPGERPAENESDRSTPTATATATTELVTAGGRTS
jgi:uncharacterized membrane protein YbhN (UPF0104 family)